MHSSNLSTFSCTQEINTLHSSHPAQMHDWQGKDLLVWKCPEGTHYISHVMLSYSQENLTSLGAYLTSLQLTPQDSLMAHYAMSEG